VWRGHDFGIWGDNKEGLKSGEPFEIPAQGMGCFSFIRANAPVINQGFRGFGGEEWYMAEMVRHNGGKVICHPKMGWNHRFNWPKRTFPLTIDDKLHNYYTGWLEIYRNINHPMMVEMTQHWISELGEDVVKLAIFKAVYITHKSAKIPLAHPAITVRIGGDVHRPNSCGCQVNDWQRHLPWQS
jgi:hypothetical protein